MALERELATFRRELDRLLTESPGKWVLVRADEVVGVFDTYQDAIRVGYQRFGLGGFLVQRIVPPEQAQWVTRPVVACRI